MASLNLITSGCFRMFYQCVIGHLKEEEMCGLLSGSSSQLSPFKSRIKRSFFSLLNFLFRVALACSEKHFRGKEENNNNNNGIVLPCFLAGWRSPSGIWVSHSGPVRPLCPHFRPELCWPAESSSLSVLCKKILLNWVRFPPSGLHRFCSSNGNNKKDKSFRSVAGILWRGKKRGVKRTEKTQGWKKVVWESKVASNSRSASKCPVRLKEAFVFIVASCVTAKTSPSPRCAPCASRCQYFEGGEL